MPHRFHQPAPEASSEELDACTLQLCFSEFLDTRALWPEYDEHALKWLLEMITRYEGRGTLRKLAIRNAKRELIGWYLYYLNPAGMSDVVQIVTKTNSVNEVLSHLFYDAWRHGSAAISGRLDPQFMQALSDKHCFLDCGPPWVLINSHDPEILGAIRSGDSMLSRLEGEMCLRFT